MFRVNTIELHQQVAVHECISENGEKRPSAHGATREEAVVRQHQYALILLPSARVRKRAKEASESQHGSSRRRTWRSEHHEAAQQCDHGDPTDDSARIDGDAEMERRLDEVFLPHTSSRFVTL